MLHSSHLFHFECEVCCARHGTRNVGASWQRQFVRAQPVQCVYVCVVCVFASAYSGVYAYACGALLLNTLS